MASAREDLLGCLCRVDRLLVLGEPGSGKTVALQRLAWELCAEDKAVLPVLVPLLFYAGTPLEDWMRALLQQTGHLRLDDNRALAAFLQEGEARCTFLFDGLNEVSPRHRDRLKDELMRWMLAYPRHAVILTGRIQDELWRTLRQQVSDAVVIQPITDAQVEAYLEAQLGEEKGRAIFGRLDARLRALAQRPLLLWLMKEAGAAGESLPGNRGELYARFVSRMLGRDTERELDARIPDRVKRKAASHLAYELHRRYALACPQDEAVSVMAQVLPGGGPRDDELQADDVLGALARHGLLICERGRGGDGHVRFPHQTLQEHFAVVLQEQAQREQALGGVHRLARDVRGLLSGQAEGLLGLAADEWWAEPFVHLAGMLDDPAWLARVLVRANPWLAWWCVEEGRAVDEATRASIEERSIRLLRSERIGDRRRAVQTLAQMQGERVVDTLFQVAADDDLEISGLAVQALAEMPEAARVLVGKALWDTNVRSWLAALRYLAVRSDEELCTRIPDRAWQDLGLPPMMYVPAGSFLMGSDDRDDGEKPQHQVDLPAFWIGKYPVTNAEFARFIEDGGYSTREYWTNAGWKRRESGKWTQPRYWGDKTYNAPNQPVVGVSWYEALAYCRWLSKRSGLEVGLPTEAQWEKAARGTDGRLYPWGNQAPTAELCNFGNPNGRPTPVGKYSPQGDSLYGCADMAGNVWEWCRSLYKPYPYNPQDGREDVEREGRRVLRGGSFYVSADLVRCAFRYWGDVDLRDGYLGFRVVSPIRL